MSNLQTLNPNTKVETIPPEPETVVMSLEYDEDGNQIEHEPDCGCEDYASDERGLATAEYAIATLAAVAFAGVLLALMSNGAVSELLMGLIKKALTN